eukprot:8967129-Pyramimonas_sp.AAC.1
MEARTDGMDPAELKGLKTAFVAQINSFIARKKCLLNRGASRDELLAGTGGADTDAFSRNQAHLSNQELMQYGRDKMKATDESAEVSNPPLTLTFTMSPQRKFNT